MQGIQWVRSVSPKSLGQEWRDKLIKLFMSETGELYADASLAYMAIPEWDGNLFLFDGKGETPDNLIGVLWATPFKEDTVRIAAFVIDKAYQSNGLGTLAFNRVVDAGINAGYTKIQLEVKAENKRAQDFYRRRGMEIVETLDGYYASGLGYVMRGKLSDAKNQ